MPGMLRVVCDFFDRHVRRGEDPVLACFLWNRLEELVRTFAFPDFEAFCRAIMGEIGKEDCVGQIRAGP